MPDRALSIGVTIDGYAVEGGFDVDGAPATSFLIAQSVGATRPSVRSTGTYDHLGELVDRAADLGCAELRVTLEWARLERRPGERDEGALGHYEAALRAARSRSMDVVVVLCDAAWPSWLGQEPWLSAWAPQRFAAHAAWLAPRLEGLARAVVTFRSPNAAAWHGWRSGTRPPFRRNATPDAVSALDGMLVAHQRAVEALAERAPSVACAIVLETARDYDDGALWCDLAGGASDAVVLAARRARWRALCARHGVRAPLARRRRPLDASSLRSTSGWPSTPPFERWLAAEDLDVLLVALEHAEGTVPLVELGAGAAGWDTQLSLAVPALSALHDSVGSLHLHGLVASTGPLERPIGLLGVDQHDGAWSLSGPDPAVAAQLAPLVSPPRRPPRPRRSARAP